jgi:hypothetical protein
VFTEPLPSKLTSASGFPAVFAEPLLSSELFQLVVTETFVG